MSKESGSKLFYDPEGNIIGKYIFEEAWMRDKNRAENNNALQKIDLRQGAIELNKWNKMNAGFAKAPFSPRTLMEMGEHIYLLLGASRDQIYRVSDHPTGFLGYFLTLAKKLRELLKEKDPGNSRIASMISSFELAANISELYNQLTLNMKQLITWQNIDKLEVQVKKNLKDADTAKFKMAEKN